MPNKKPKKATKKSPKKKPDEQLTLLQKMKNDLIQVSLVPATTIIPRSWDSWFWNKLADSQQLTWGDAAHTLITVDHLDRICTDIFDDDELLLVEQLMKNLATFEQLYGHFYIDMEN